MIKTYLLKVKNKRIRVYTYISSYYKIYFEMFIFYFD